MPRTTRFARLVCLSLSLAPSLAHGADPVTPATATSSIAALHLPEVTQTRLDNGLTVVLEENHATPFVSMQVRYDAGSREDPPGKEGLAGIVHGMTMRGTKHVSAGEYDGTLARIGASDAGWQVTIDELDEWATVPSNAVDSVLWLWSDQMGFFAPNQEALESARAAKDRERNSKVTNAPLGAVSEIVQRALFPEGHPYHLVPIGHSSDTITLDDARAFHDRNLAPNTAVLVLVGDFRSAAVLDRIRTYFAPITAAPPGEAAPIAPAQRDGDVRLDIVANVNAAEVWMDWRTPPFYAAGDAELDIAARALVGARVSALRWGLIDRAQVATHVSARQISHALGSDFRITVTVAPGHTPEEVIAGLDATLDVLGKHPLKDEVFAGARANMIVPYVQGLDRAMRRAAVYGELTLAHRDPRAMTSDAGRYDAITNTDVFATMARWLTKGHRVITVVTPDASAPVSGALRVTRGAK